MAGFETFNLGNVLQKSEQINTARHRNNALAEASQPNSPQRQIIQENITAKKQANATGEYNAQIQNLTTLNMAAAEIRQNPGAWPRWKEKVQQIDPRFNFDGMPPEQIMDHAGKAFQSTTEALRAYHGQKNQPVNRMGKYNPGDYTSESWAAFNEAGGTDVQSGLLQRYEKPKVVQIEGVPNALDLSGGNTTTTPLSSRAAETQAKVDETTAVIEAETAVKDTSAVQSEYDQAVAEMPGLQQVVDELISLAPEATSTYGGQAVDFASHQLGLGATDGAVARTKFSSMINNQVLPLLKSTFGAAFTVSEGDSLRATMGDVNKSAKEKIAVLNAFIDQKYRDIETKKRRLDRVDAMDAELDAMSNEELQAIINEQ